MFGDASHVPTTGWSFEATRGFLGTISFPVFGFGSSITTAGSATIIGAMAGTFSTTSSLTISF